MSEGGRGKTGKRKSSALSLPSSTVERLAAVAVRLHRCRFQTTSSTGAELVRKQYRSKCNRRRKRGAELLRPVSQYPVVRGWGWGWIPGRRVLGVVVVFAVSCLQFAIYREEKCISFVAMREDQEGLWVCKS
ncbi:hypothetical protein C8R45DRAFT_1218370 [Mycena sanguinolenta]|nr:hypothetical protein C8R45DRAFT_1218370 [Mycena sanguinolenta]